MKKNTKSYSSSLAGGKAAILSNPEICSRDKTSFDSPRPRTNKGSENTPAPRESGSPPDSLSRGGPVLFCTCNVLIAYDDAGSLVDPDCDPQEYFWQCPLHQMKINEHFIWRTLSSLMWNRRILTPEGIKLLRLLVEASDKRNPYIPQLEMVRKEIQKTIKAGEWAAFAREKTEEWYQKDQHSRLTTGEEIPIPEWLKRHHAGPEIDRSKILDDLREQEWQLECAVRDFRYTDNYNYNSGG